jgi:hypothetical protein
MIPKSVQRFSEGIMLKQAREPVRQGRWLPRRALIACSAAATPVR